MAADTLSGIWPWLVTAAVAARLQPLPQSWGCI